MGKHNVRKDSDCPRVSVDVEVAPGEEHACSALYSVELFNIADSKFSFIEQDHAELRCDGQKRRFVGILYAELN